MIAIIGDLHLGSKSFHKGVFEAQMSFFEQQLFPFLEQKSIDVLVIAGDVWHNRNYTDNYILQSVKERFFDRLREMGVSVYIPCGNHDTYYKHTLEFNTLTSNLREYENVHVVLKPTVVKLESYKFTFVPWIIGQPPELPKSDVVVGHFDIVDFLMTKGQRSTEGLGADYFSKHRMVLSGHYHIKSHRKNITYLGTPYQLTWGDFDEQKGFWTLDDDFDLQFHENEVNPKFLKFFYSEKDADTCLKVVGLTFDGKPTAMELNEGVSLAKKNYVKLMTGEVETQSILDAFFNSLTLESLDKIEVVNNNEVIENLDLSEVEEELAEDSDLASTINTYIKGMTFGPGIDKERLIEMSAALLKEAAEATDTREV